MFERRINFKKYGLQKDSNMTETISEITENLPPNVYCDLVTTLNSKCLMSNLLEIWRLTLHICYQILTDTYSGTILNTSIPLQQKKFYLPSIPWRGVLGMGIIPTTLNFLVESPVIPVDMWCPPRQLSCSGVLLFLMMWKLT